MAEEYIERGRMGIAGAAAVVRPVRDQDTGDLRRRHVNLKDLLQLYHLNREIEADMERLARLKAGTLPGIPVLTGMPVSSGTADKTAQYAAEITDLRRIIEAKQRQCMYERSRLERYIAEIPDSLTRQIFTLRFVEGLSWPQVALGVGGGNTEESVRKRVYRYIKGSEK